MSRRGLFARMRLSGPAGITLLYALFAGLWILLSGWLLETTIEDAAILARLEQFKGLLFVAVTSALLYVLLRVLHGLIAISPSGATDPHAAPVPRMHDLALVLVGLVLMVPLMAFVIGIIAGRDLEQQALADLERIAVLKAAHIDGWLTERRANARVLAGDRHFIDQVRQLMDGRDAEMLPPVTSRLAAVHSAHNYDAVHLLDGAGRVLASAGREHAFDRQVLDLVAQAREPGIVHGGDIQIDASGLRHMHFAVQLLPQAGTAGERSAVVVIHSDPESFLFPYLEDWSGLKYNGETLLLRRDGDRITFLNRTRFSDQSLPENGLDLPDSPLPSAAAVIDADPGTIVGRDYRGVPVLAAYRPIPGTDWRLLVKADRDEVRAPLHRLQFWVSLVALFAVAAIGTVLLMFWLQRQRLEELKLRAEQARADRLLRHFFELPFIGMASCGAADLRWGRVNDRLCEILGYSHEELAKMTWEEVTHPGDLPAERCEFDRLLRGEADGYCMEKRYLRKDGSIVPVKIDVRCVRKQSGEADYFLATIEDIGNRKQHEARIERLTRMYAALSYSNQAIVRCRDEGELLPAMCEAAVAHGGMSGAWIGLIDPESGDPRPAVGSGSDTAALDRLWRDGTGGNEGLGPVAEAMRRNRPVWWQAGDGGPFEDFAATSGWRAAAVLPLHRGGSAMGVYLLYSDVAGFFDGDIRGLVQELATDVDHALAGLDQAAARRRAEAALMESYHRYQSLVESAPIPIFINRGDSITFVNRAALKLFGAESPDQLLGRSPFDLIHPDFHAVVRQRLVRLREYGEPVPEVEEKYVRLDGRVVDVEVSATPFQDQGMTAEHVMLRDISERKEAEARIERLAFFDPLTELPNRTLLGDRAARAISAARRRNGSLAVLFLDLDHFKNVNDSLGHRIGDSLLLEATRRLLDVVRGEDTVSRLGGDEFMLIIQGVDADGAARVAEKLLATFSEPFHLENQEILVTASIGIALYPADGTKFETLYSAADTAMYRAKRDGRNGYCFFTVEMQAQAMRYLKVENALRHALQQNEFRLVYQPQIALADGRVVGAEALLRWQQPALGDVPPSEFIPIAESSGQILPIGEWVLRTAAAELKTWLDDGIGELTMAVNLSAVQFRHPRLPEAIVEIAGEAGLPARLLELELTESTTMDDPERARVTLERLNGVGVRLAIDDFGTGYSSLGYLKRFKVHKLKIDQSFVRDLLVDPEDHAIVQAIIRLAGSLEMRTIAEGVETAEQREVLRAMGCDEIQGWLVSRPLDAAAFGEFLAARRPRARRRPAAGRRT
jgi:diguanylate cyclase (GGDEF)-like protein/PAS domain S-box-containing protein